MTDDKRHTIEAFKVGVSLIKTGADGFPLAGQSLELHVLSLKVLEVDSILLGRDDLDAEQRSVLNLADATSKWIAETDSDNRDPAIAEAWFRARAELIEPHERPKK